MRIPLLVAAALAIAAPALAQQPPPPREQTTRIDVTEDELVDGATLSPGDIWITVQKRAGHPSMIPIRAHFLPEMRRSAEQL